MLISASKSTPTAPPTPVASIDTSSSTGEVQTLSASASAVVEQMVVPPEGASEDGEYCNVACIVEIVSRQYYFFRSFSVNFLACLLPLMSFQ